MVACLNKKTTEMKVEIKKNFTFAIYSVESEV